jgi:hypothetical protein
MSCRPVRDNAFACTLDGALEEGETCKAHAQCGANLICITGRCARLSVP